MSSCTGVRGRLAGPACAGHIRLVIAIPRSPTSDGWDTLRRSHGLGEAFCRPAKGEHHVRSETAGFFGRRRNRLIGSAGDGAPGRRRRPELHEQRPRPAARRQGTADLQVRAGEVGRQGHRQQLRQGGDGRAVADLQGDRRRLDAARAGRDARAALARHRGRVGVRASRAASARRSSTRRATPRPTTSSRATSGTSRAATATCSNAWATSRATSS